MAKDVHSRRGSQGPGKHRSGSERRIGGTAVILGFGEAGTAIAHGLGAGASGSGPGSFEQILALDVAAADDNPRGVALQKRATEMGIHLHTQAGDWLAAADLVISAVVGPQALPIAGAVAEYLRPNTLYADLNTASPETMQAEASVLEPLGITFVDVAVLGSFRQHGHRVPMMLAGRGARTLAARLEPLGFSMTVISETPGDASAVKMLRSVFMKGLEALCVECFAAAEEQGLRGRVLEALRDLDREPIASTIEVLIRTHVLHAQRRLEEVSWVGDSLHRAGFDLIMTEASRRVFARTVEAEGTPPEDLPTLEQSLGLLRRITRGG